MADDNIDAETTADALARFILCIIAGAIGMIEVINCATSLIMLDSLASRYPLVVSDQKALLL